MRIAQIAPLDERVPPKYYGGTERVVSYLTDQLVAMGHDVVLYASGDSQTLAKLVAVCDHALRLDSQYENRMIYYMLLLEKVMAEAEQFDVIHSHVDFLIYPFARRMPVPVVSTLHGRLDLPALVPLYREYDDIPVVSISNSQREPLPWINWIGTVYHGLPPSLYACQRGNHQWYEPQGSAFPHDTRQAALNQPNQPHSGGEEETKPTPYSANGGKPHSGAEGEAPVALPLEGATRAPIIEDYCLFLGRISPEKRVDRAIEITKKAGCRLIVAAKVDITDRDYFEKQIRPLMDLPHVDYIGEVSEKEKRVLLQKAKAHLFPIDWPEPFGMVMIEAMACGTPTIAYAHGSVPEIIQEGVNGFIVHSVEEACEALDKVADFDRLRCRYYFEEHFSSQRMATDYVKIYEQLLTHTTLKEGPAFYGEHLGRNYPF